MSVCVCLFVSKEWGKKRRKRIRKIIRGEGLLVRAPLNKRGRKRGRKNERKTKEEGSEEGREKQSKRERERAKQTKKQR